MPPGKNRALPGERPRPETGSQQQAAAMGGTHGAKPLCNAPHADWLPKNLLTLQHLMELVQKLPWAHFETLSLQDQDKIERATAAFSRLVSKAAPQAATTKFPLPKMRQCSLADTFSSNYGKGMQNSTQQPTNDAINQPCGPKGVPSRKDSSEKTIIAGPHGASVVTPKMISGSQTGIQAGTLSSKDKPMPIWQFAETNQGLLTFCALVVTLGAFMVASGFGFIQWRMNVQAGNVRRQEQVDMAVGLIDEISNFTSEISVRFASGEDFKPCVRDWRAKIIAPRFAVDAIRANPSGDALLAIEINRLWTSLQMEDSVDSSKGDYKSRLSDMETTLQKSKMDIQARR